MKEFIAIVQWFAMTFLFVTGLCVAGTCNVAVGILIMILTLILMPICGDKLDKAFVVQGY